MLAYDDEGNEVRLGEPKPAAPKQQGMGLGLSVMQRLSTDPDLKLQPHHAAGVVGNLATETGWFKNMQEIQPTVAGSRGGYGWAQWTGPRRQQFEAFARDKGLDINSEEANYQFLKQELLTTERPALERLKQATNYQEASDAFMAGYERPGVAATGSRRRNARKLMMAFGNGETAADAPSIGYTDDQVTLPKAITDADVRQSMQAEMPSAPSTPVEPPSLLQRGKNLLNDVGSAIAPPPVKNLTPPARPPELLRQDTAFRELESGLQMNLNPQFVEQVQQAYEASTPEQRQRLMEQPGETGQVARYIDRKYQSAAGVTSLNPRLAGIGGRREDVTARNLGGGMEPQSAAMMADREVRFPGAMKPTGQIQSTTFDFERANQLRNAGPLARGVEQGVDQIKSQAAGLNKMAGDLGVALGIPGAADYSRAQMKARDGLKMRQNEVGEAPNAFNRNLEGAIASTLANAPGMVAGLFTGGSAGPLLGMGAQVAGDEYARGIDEGLDSQQAFARSIAFGAAEIIGEKLGFKDQVQLLKNVAKGSWAEFEKLFVRNLAEQAVGEQLTTVAEARIDGSPVGLNKELTAKELFNQMKETLYQTVLQTTIMGAPGAMGAAARSLKKTDTRYDQQFADAFAPLRESPESAAAYDNIINQKVGKLWRENPEFKEILRTEALPGKRGIEQGRQARAILAEREAIRASAPPLSVIEQKAQDLASTPAQNDKPEDTTISSTGIPGATDAQDPISASSPPAGQAGQAGSAEEIQPTPDPAATTPGLGSLKEQGYTLNDLGDGTIAILDPQGQTYSTYTDAQAALDAFEVPPTQEITNERQNQETSTAGQEGLLDATNPTGSTGSNVAGATAGTDLAPGAESGTGVGTGDAGVRLESGQPDRDGGGAAPTSAAVDPLGQPALANETTQAPIGAAPQAGQPAPAGAGFLNVETGATMPSPVAPAQPGIPQVGDTASSADRAESAVPLTRQPEQNTKVYWDSLDEAGKTAWAEELGMPEIRTQAWEQIPLQTRRLIKGVSAPQVTPQATLTAKQEGELRGQNAVRAKLNKPPITPEEYLASVQSDLAASNRNDDVISEYNAAVDRQNTAISQRNGGSGGVLRARVKRATALPRRGFVQRKIAESIAKVFGHRIVYIEHETAGKPLDVNGSIVTTRPDVILLASDSTDTLSRVAAHELTHGLRMRAPEVYSGMVKALREVYSPIRVMEHLEDRDYGTAIPSPSDDPMVRNTTNINEEEWVADFVSDVMHKPMALFRVAVAMNRNKKNSGGRFLRHVDNFLSSLTQKLSGAGFNAEAAIAKQNLQRARNAVTEALAQYANYQQTGTEPSFEGPEIVDSKKRDVDATAGQEFTSRDNVGEYNLSVERAERKRNSKSSLSPEETQTITAAAVDKGVSAKDALAAVRARKNDYPLSAGWHPMEAAGIETKSSKKGGTLIQPLFKKVIYTFNKSPGETKIPKEKWARTMADRLTKEVQEIIKRAEQGDANAKIIMGHANWYRAMADRLRAEFGGFADVFADLLGATSPQTAVPQNWKDAIHALRRFVRGDYDAQLAEFEQWLADGKTIDKFKKEKADQLITKITGRKFGANSDKAMKAMLGMWRAIQQGDAPKARNFALNLIGQSDKATIDLWASRLLQRLAGHLRLPPPLETAVPGNHLADASKVGGAFGFAQDVFELSAEDLRRGGLNIRAPDLQAIVWFLEKEYWTKNNWTNKAGEGGSFEEQLDKTPTSVYQAGFSIQQDAPPSDKDVAAAMREVGAVLKNDENVMAYRMLPTRGLYGNDVERSFDTEVVGNQQWQPGEWGATLAKMAKETSQKDIFISRVLGPNEQHPNARPGLVISFKNDLTAEQVEPILNTLRANGVDGFTLSVSPIHARTLKGGQEAKSFQGIRIQYVPEFTLRAVEQGWKHDAEEVRKLTSNDVEQVQEVTRARRDVMAEAAKALTNDDAVAHVQIYSFDTLVIGKENYADYSGSPERVNREVGKGSPGQSIAERLQAAARRYRILGRQDGGAAILQRESGGPDIPARNRREEAAGRPDAGSVPESGRVRGSERVLAEPRRPYQGDGRLGTSLQGLPSRIEVDGELVEFAGYAPAQEAARRYMEKAGLKYNPVKQYAKVNKARAKRIADAFDAMPHNPQNAAVRMAYRQMIKETAAQYQAILDTGLQIEFIDIAKTGDPYGNPRNAILDVVENNHLWVFSTRDGFGSSEDFDPVNNPLLQETQFKISGQVALANDLFRAVHDYFGHIKEGVGFRAEGEENAWRIHSSMYSSIARRAMTTETRGQNSWVNFGPFGEYNQTASGEDTKYADQKIGLLPKWVSDEGATDTDIPASNRRSDAASNERVGAGSASEGRPSYGQTKRGAVRGVGVHFSSAERQELDGSFYGTGAKGEEAERVKNSADKRLASRIYFYINAGQGVSPEQGVGGNAHTVLLKNLYDINADPLSLVDNVQGATKDKQYDAMESAILDAGFDGYVADFGTQRAAVLIGDHKVPVRFEGQTRPQVEEGERAEPNTNKRLARLMGQEWSRKTPQAWGEFVKSKNPFLFERYADAFTGTREKFWPDEMASRVKSGVADIPASNRRVQTEYEGVVARYKDTPEWLKAPNGKASNLPERMWVQVRTNSFKRWFGDWEQFANGRDGNGVWEDDAKLVSKVVDDNGEPKIVYHGTITGGFTVLDPDKSDSHRSPMVFTAGNRSTSRTYSGATGEIDMGMPPEDVPDFENLGYQFDDTEDGVDLWDPNGNLVGTFKSFDEAMQEAGDDFKNYGDGYRENDERGIYSLFLNIRNPFEENFEGANWDGDASGLYEVTDDDGFENMYGPKGERLMSYEDAEALVEKQGGNIREATPLDGTTNTIAEEAKRYGHDGAIIRNVVDDGGRGGYADADDIFVIFDAKQAKSATQNTGEFGDVTDLRFSNRRAPTFYSQLARGFDTAKQDSMPGSQWRAWLFSNQAKLGIKADEIAWTGIEDFLKLKGKEKTTKADIAAFLADNGVQVNEVMKGTGEVEPVDARFPTREAAEAAQRFANGGAVMQVGDEWSFGRPVNSTKFSSYTIPGGENYRELLITLPDKPTELPEEIYKSGDDIRVKSDVFVDAGFMADGVEAAAGFFDARGSLQSALQQQDALIGRGYGYTAAQKEAGAILRAIIQGQEKRVKKARAEAEQKRYRSGHWDEPNVLAHLRFDERQDADGNRVMFVQEIQSDWGQKGKKKGFAGQERLAYQVVVDGNAAGAYDTMQEAEAAKQRALRFNPPELVTIREVRGKTQEVFTTPTAPFVTDTKSWTSLAIKRAIRYAAENGFDKIAFANGQQNADLYDLSKQVDEIAVPMVNADSRSVRIETGQGQSFKLMVGNDGVVTGQRSSDQFTGKTLDEVVGKDMADKIMALDAPSTFSGEGLKVGGEGMRAFYDQIVPSVANDVLKKLGGGRVGSVALGGVTPDMLDQIALADYDGRYDDLSDRAQRSVMAVAQERAGKTALQQPGFTITGEMRDKVLDEGMPLFSNRRNVLDQIPLVNWTAPDEAKLDDWIYKLADKQIDTKRVVEKLKASDAWNPYQKETLYHGKAEYETNNFKVNEVKPLLDAMSTRGISIGDLETYLWNRHAPEANAYYARVNPEQFPDGGSGIKTQDALDYLANLPAGVRTDLEAIANQVDAILRETRDILVREGLETQETIDAWEAAYQHYIPLQRESAEISERGMGTGQGFSVKGPASKRRTGSGKAAADILAQVMMQRERVITRAEKNRVALSLYGLAIQNPNPGFWYAVNPDAITQPAKVAQELIDQGMLDTDIAGIIKEPTEARINPRTGLVEHKINPMLRNRPNVLAVRIKGKDRFLFFSTEDARAVRMAESLKNLDAADLGGVWNVFRTVTRYVSSINTQYNPIFGVVNLIRDTQGGLLNLSSTPLAGQQGKVMTGVGPALRGIYADLRADRKGQPRSGNEWSKLWEEFQQVGGKTGYRDMFRTAEDRGDALQKELQKAAEGKVKRFGRGVFDWLSDYNETLENAVRLSAYKAGIESGMTKDQSAVLAKDLTVNFNRKGQIASQMGSLYAFFNASAQGSVRLAQTLRGPAGKKIMAGGVLLGVMQSVLMAMAGYDDDEPPEFVRERNFILPIGDGKYLTVPYPLGFHALPNMGRVVTDIALSGGRDGGKKVAGLLGSLFETFNPIGSAGWSVQTIAPTFADPLVALSENRDSFGKPIAKEDRSSLSPTPGFSRTKDTASVLSKKLAWGINRLSGGSEYTQGVISPTPDQLDFLFGQVTGGVGREVMKLEQAATSWMSGEELPPYKYPLGVGRFIGNTNAQASDANRFYANLTRLNELEAELKGRAKEGEDVKGFMKDNPEASLVGMANAAETTVTKLRSMKRKMIAAKRPKAEVKQIETRIQSVMKSLNDRVRPMRESPIERALRN